MSNASQKPSFIRWGRVTSITVILVILTVLIILCLDPFLKWVLIKSGQGVFGARVDIASVKTTLSKSRLSIRGLLVADKSEPMMNLFQWDEASFDFRSLPLLEKKLFIDEAALKGLKFGTARKTSGALLLEDNRPGFVGKATAKLWSQVETISLEKFEATKQAYDPKTVMGSLQSIKVADQAKTQLQKAPDELQKQLTQLNAAQRADELKKRVNTLGQNRGSGPEALLNKVSEAKALEADIHTFRNDITHTQKNMTDQIRSAQGLVEQVRKAKEDDWKTLRSKLSLPSLDKTAIANALWGPHVAQWGERLLNGVHTVRQNMPAKPQSPPPPPRGHGRIIEFPRTNVLPRFTLAKAQVSGEVGQDKPFGFSGTLTGITTNPPLYGKPAIIQLHGDQASRSFDVKGVLDHTQDTPLESIQASYAGFSLNNLFFGQTDGMGFRLKQGEGRARGVITVQGDTLNGHAELQGNDLSLDPHVDLKSNSAVAQRATQHITASLANVKSLNMGVGISGTLESPNVSIESNIGSVVSDALKSALGAEVAEQEKALRAELDKQTAGKIQELQGLADGLQQKYLPQLASNNKIVDDLLVQLKSAGAGPGAGKPLDSLKNMFGH